MVAMTTWECVLIICHVCLLAEGGWLGEISGNEKDIYDISFLRNSW